MEKPETRIRGILRRLRIVAKWTIGIVFVLGLLLVGINSFDEDLSPEAKALLIPPPNPYRPEENLYFALLGFEAKAGESPTEVGQARVAAYEKEIAAALNNPPSDVTDFPDQAWQKREKLEFRGKIGFCAPLLKSCLSGGRAHAGEIAQLLKDNQDLYKRYARLRALKGYHETATPSLYGFDAHPPQAVRQLYLANIAWGAGSRQHPRRNAAISDLLADIQVWRLVLTGSGSLISKMIAVANLQGDYALLGDIIADDRIDLSDTSTQIRTLLESPENHWKIGRIFAYEFRLRAYIWNQMLAESDKQTIWDRSEDSTWWERVGTRVSWIFFKFNSTQNLDAQIAMRLQAMADAEPARFLSIRDEYHDWVRENLYLFQLSNLYNPVGKTLLSVGTYAYEDYPLRSYDGAAFQRMVRLGYEIRRQRIADKAIPEFMRQNPHWASHPVDGRPFLWDEKKREITVQTLGKQPGGRRFSIPVWSAVANQDRLP